MADTLNIKPEEQVEDQKHIDEMVAKAEGKETAEEEQLLAGKYKSEEDLQKGILELLKKDKGEEASLEDLYKELESKVLKSNEEEPEEEPVVEEKELEDLEKKMEDSPVDFSEYEQEFFEKGEISEESYEKLKEKGFDKALVDRYIEGVQAIAEKQANQVFEAVGGQEQYEQMIAWAADNLSEKEKEIFNKQVQTTDIDQAKFAVEALYGKYMRTEGGKPNRILQGGAANQTVTGGRFNSRQEVTEAMNNPKYQKDPAYRAEVERKLRNSDVF